MGLASSRYFTVRSLPVEVNVMILTHTFRIPSHFWYIVLPTPLDGLLWPAYGCRFSTSIRSLPNYSYDYGTSYIPSTLDYACVTGPSRRGAVVVSTCAAALGSFFYPGGGGVVLGLSLVGEGWYFGFISGRFPLGTFSAGPGNPMIQAAYGRKR